MPRAGAGRAGVSGAPPAFTRRRDAVVERLALAPGVAAASGAVFLMGLGEELWKRFVPRYLEALGAPVLAIGLYGTARDFLDGVYQYPGGWIADRWGRRRALLLFVGVAAAGYVVYALASGWPAVFVGLALVMAWSSMASPALFAVVGDALPRGRRTMGFTVQAILRRVPMAIAPALGGALIAAHGVRGGVRVGLAITLLLAVLTLWTVSRVRVALPTAPAPASMREVWRALPLPLRRLLGSDVLVRACEGLVDVFVVLWVMGVAGLGAAQYGVLVGVQMITSIVVYLPAAALAGRIGRKPLVVATFLAFALFPLAVVLADGFAGLAAAFVVGGLRETGEPARKALIVDLAAPHLRARSVGLYYLARSLAVSPAALAGAFLWRVDPALPF
ncbi:MAG TPA: MFS transporter, partial [Longimicrobiaceae bacterium]|nr:MFS transporter [Longimicrobiaceae bacterium]